jgi:hypothetical protein
MIGPAVGEPLAFSAQCSSPGKTTHAFAPLPPRDMLTSHSHHASRLNSSVEHVVITSSAASVEGWPVCFYRGVLLFFSCLPIVFLVVNRGPTERLHSPVLVEKEQNNTPSRYTYRASKNMAAIHPYVITMLRPSKLLLNARHGNLQRRIKTSILSLSAPHS